MIVKLPARTPLCRAWPSPSTSVEVHYRLSHQPQTDEQKQQNAPTPASNSRIPAAKALPRRPHKAECQQQRRSHVSLKRPNASCEGASTSVSNDRMPAAKTLPGWPQTTECQQQRRSHASLKRPNASSKSASTSASNDRMPAAKIMIFTKRHNKMPKKPPPEEKESLQAYVRLQASLMIKPVWSWSIKPLRESQQLPQREPL